MSETYAVNGGRLYVPTQDHLVDDSSLSIVDMGIINTIGGTIARWFPNLISVVLCFSGDMQSDFSRLRQIQASVASTHSARRPATGPTFPALCINRVDLAFDPSYRPTQSDKYQTIIDGKAVQYQMVVLRYAARVYTQSYKLATRCLEGIVLGSQVQMSFSYNLPWIQQQNLTGTFSLSIPQITETSSFPAQEAEGPIYVVSFNITARALIFDPPDLITDRPVAGIVYTAVANFHYIGFDGKTILDDVYCPPCQRYEPIIGGFTILPNGKLVQDGYITGYGIDLPPGTPPAIKLPTTNGTTKPYDDEPVCDEESTT